MNETEARLILQSFQPGVGDESDPQFAEALRAAANNPELARWWTEEQDFDRAIAAQLGALPEPFGLKTRILAQQVAPARRSSSRWILGLFSAFAALLLLALGFGFFRPAPAGNLTADYAREMTSFIRLSPQLDMESDDLGEFKTWLVKNDMKPVTVPNRLAALQPLGCRVLSFRGQNVTLICFASEGNRLAHLFVVDRAALPQMKPGSKPVFANDNGWMTATWAEGDRVYMITMQGGRAALEQYLPSA